jgi:precorrin-2 dehydrogenase/sirohydrochlorin ferrochelatase
VVAAIGTGGGSPMLATLLRHDIEARVPEGTGRIAALFRAMQTEVRDALPEAHARRRFLRAALTGPAAEAAMAGDMAGAKERLRAALFESPQLSGAVQYVDARGPADLLTLRAARTLAAADVLAPDADAHPDILALARRDAERLGPQSVGQLRDLAAEGLRVARLVTDPAWRTEQAELVAAGVSTEVLPIAG